MPKTAVGLFKDAKVVEIVVSEIQRLGFPRQEVRTLEEPAAFEVTGVMSFPRLDFEVELQRELAKIGATEAEAKVYLDGLRAGGALVLATGEDHQADAAADIMNRHGALGLEESIGPEPHLPEVGGQQRSPFRESPVLAGRAQQRGGGASLFVW